MTNKKTNPSTSLSDSISNFTQSATKAFHELQAEVRVEVKRAEAETERVRTERNQALKALQDSKREQQKHKEEILAYKASTIQLKEAELTIKHHVEDFTILQRETNQWRDRAKNWQEHFLRVEEERCSLASRLDELEAERHIPLVTPNPSKTVPSTPTMQQPPTYNSAVPPSTQILREHQQARPTKTNKRKAPSQSELPPYSETAQTPRTTKSAAAADASTSTTSTTNRSNRKQTSSSSSRPKKASSEVLEVASVPQEPRQILIRRVHAVVEVKREEDSDEDLRSATPPESPEVNTPRRSRNARRTRQILDEEDYVPEGKSVGNQLREDDDDELMIAAGDDLSFDVGSPSVITRASATATRIPNKKRKLNATSSKAKRKL